MTSWRVKPLIGIHDLNVTHRGLSFVEIQVAYRQVGLTKMWKNCVKSSRRTDGGGMTMYKGVWRKISREKRAEEGRTEDWLLHHANLPDRTISSCQQLVIENNTLSVPIIVQSSILGPCDFFLFQKIKILVKERGFGDNADIKTEP